MKKEDKTGRRNNNKIESIYVTDDMLTDPGMDEFLRQSMIEEADRLEEELNSDPELMGIGASDDLFFKIKARLQEMGAWEEDGEECEKEKAEEVSKAEEAAEEEKDEGAEKGKIGEAEQETAKREAETAEEEQEIKRTESRRKITAEEEFAEGRGIKRISKKDLEREPKKDLERDLERDAKKNLKRDLEIDAERDSGRNSRENREIKTEEETEAQKGQERQEEKAREDVYRLLSEEDREALEIGRKIRTRRKKKRRRWKQVTAAAVAASIILAVGMQGDAGRNWILDAFNRFISATGNRLRINYRDERENVKSDEEKEQEAWEKIKEELNIPVIQFSYKPDEMVFDKANILKELNRVDLYYWYRETIVHIYIEYGKMNSSASFISEEDSFLQDVVTNGQKIEMKIWNTSTGSVESYVASFKYQDVLYFINGRLPLEEMEKMMNFLYLY